MKGEKIFETPTVEKSVFSTVTGSWLPAVTLLACIWHRLRRTNRQSRRSEGINGQGCLKICTFSFANTAFGPHVNTNGMLLPEAQTTEICETLDGADDDSDEMVPGEKDSAAAKTAVHSRFVWRGKMRPRLSVDGCLTDSQAPGPNGVLEKVCHRNGDHWLRYFTNGMITVDV